MQILCIALSNVSHDCGMNALLLFPLLGIVAYQQEVVVCRPLEHAKVSGAGQLNCCNFSFCIIT